MIGCLAEGGGPERSGDRQRQFHAPACLRLRRALDIQENIGISLTCLLPMLISKSTSFGGMNAIANLLGGDAHGQNRGDGKHIPPKPGLELPLQQIRRSHAERRSGVDPSGPFGLGTVLLAPGGSALLTTEVFDGAAALNSAVGAARGVVEVTWSGLEATFSAPENTPDLAGISFSVADKTFGTGETTFYVAAGIFSLAVRTFAVREKTLAVVAATFSAGEKTLPFADKTLSAADKTPSATEKETSAVRAATGRAEKAAFCPETPVSARRSAFPISSHTSFTTQKHPCHRNRSLGTASMPKATRSTGTRRA